MSYIPVTELIDQECEKGQLTQRPPIPYATPKAETILKASRETVKMKTSEGEVKMAVLGDNPGPEEYLQEHLNSFLRMLSISRKKWDDEMSKLTKAVQTITARVRKLARTPNEETEPQTSFNKTTLTSIVLSHLPAAWRTQYALMHALVPESPRAILVDLENIEKLFAEKANEAARANKAKVAAATKASEQVPRKGKRTHGGGPEKGTPKKGRTDKFCKWCKSVDGLFTTHNTTDCCRFNKDGSQKDRLTKPFDSAK